MTEAATEIIDAPADAERCRCGQPVNRFGLCHDCGKTFCTYCWLSHRCCGMPPRPAEIRVFACKGCGEHWPAGYRVDAAGDIYCRRCQAEREPTVKVVLEVPAMPDGKWQRFRAKELCPVCGHDGGWCTVSPDGDLIRCMRVPSERPSEGRDGQRGWLHPIPDGPAAVPSEKLQPYSVTGPKRNPAEWALLVKQQRSALSPDKLEKLSAKLGVTADSLRAFGIGWDAASSCYSFPMYDATRQVIGMRLRVPEPRDGRRWICVRGSSNGLFIPDDYMPVRGDPLICPEGPTCAAAARDRGLRAVGRANSTAATHLLAGLLRAGKVPQDVVVMGENDGPVWAMVPNPPPPQYPGFEGALACCRAIHADCGRLRCVVPPRPHKDLRDWVKDGGATLSDVAGAVEHARDIKPEWFLRAEQRLQQRREEAVATFARMVDRIVLHNEKGTREGYARAERVRAWAVRRGWPIDVRREAAA